MDAYLLCPETRKVMWLGRVVEKPDSGDRGQVEYFHRGPGGGLLNHEDPEVNATIWKFLAEHACKSLKIVYAGEYDEEEYELVGSGDVETYLRGWPVRPRDFFAAGPTSIAGDEALKAEVTRQMLNLVELLVHKRYDRFAAESGGHLTEQWIRNAVESYPAELMSDPEQSAKSIRLTGWPVVAMSLCTQEGLSALTVRAVAEPVGKDGVAVVPVLLYVREAV